MSEQIKCLICGGLTHSIQLHLKSDHPEISVEAYVKRYPEMPLLSEVAKAALEKRQAQTAATTPAKPAASMVGAGATIKKAFHEIFNLGKVKGAMSAKGEGIPISVFPKPEQPEYVSQASDDYVYDIDELKNAVLALELNIPCYVWGHKGAGKSELWDQITARTGRGIMRVQHTVNTEESHIVGQWRVKGGETVFELGPLPVAMKLGLTYLADEYDFMLPSVSSVYQAVLEGKPLVIKEADPDNRIIRPHPNFRFVATGNTNGSGDETGLYQGTVLGNSANYDRFGMVIKKDYMKKAAESQILQNRVSLAKEDADKLVEFAGLVREAYDSAKISDVISPRTLIYAARIGIKRGSFRQGVGLSFINKLSRVDAEVCGGLAQRIFG